MQLKIRHLQPAVIDGEPIELALELHNDELLPLHLPKLDDVRAPFPRFVIEGPSFQKPHDFHWFRPEPVPHGHGHGHAHVHGQGTAGFGEPALASAVAAGQRVEATLVLPAALPLRTPGAHVLRATYVAGGSSAQSNPVTVNVEPGTASTWRVVGRTPLRSVLGLQLLAVKGSTLYLAGFDEQRPDLGETQFTGFTRVADADAGATDFFAPWCQTAEPGLVTPRFGWRTGQTVVVAGFRKAAQRLDLPFVPRVHAPSLMAASGDIDLLVSDPAGRRLSLLRFPHVGYDETPPAARVMWTAELPATLLDLAATTGPSGARRALLREAAAVRLLQWDDAGPRIGEPLPLPGPALAAVAPALHLSAAGVLRATVATTVPADPRQVTLTQLTWAAGGGAPELKSEPALSLASSVRTGTVAYSMRSVETPRRDWVFVLESGRAQTSQSGGRSYVSKRRQAVPPVVLVMEDVSYSLELHTRPELGMLR